MQSTLPPARRKRRRRALNIPAVVGLVLLVLALVLGALLMLVRGQGQTPGAEAFVPAAGPLPEVQADRAQSREGEEFHYLLDGSPAFDAAGEWAALYLENCTVNREYMQVTYLLEDGTAVCESPLIPPGHHLLMGRPEEALDPGSYPAEAVITVYASEEAEDAIGCFEEKVTVTVK